MVSHELRNPLSAIVQSSDMVMNSLERLLAQESIPSAMSHKLTDDIETMKGIGLCTVHMRHLIDDTINVQPILDATDCRYRNLKAECFKLRQWTAIR